MIGSKRIDGEVLSVLEAVECEGSELRIVQQLDRPLYAKTAKVLQALGGKWNRKAQATIFPEDAWPLIADAVATGEFVDAKKQYQAYFTPASVCDALCERLGVSAGTRALEPSAGSGNIAKSLRSHGAQVDCIEIQEGFCGQLANEGFPVIHKDFLEVSVDSLAPYDFVVMNPPFARSQDIAHIRHGFDFLRPGGTLAAIASPGWTFRNDRKALEFREWLQELDYDSEDLPEGTFKDSGTMVRTVQLVIQKP